MRPRGIPAENQKKAQVKYRDAYSFNEAAGNTRGKLSAGADGVTDAEGFNEAAGNTRGKQFHH